MARRKLGESKALLKPLCRPPPCSVHRAAAGAAQMLEPLQAAAAAIVPPTPLQTRRKRCRWPRRPPHRHRRRHRAADRTLGSARAEVRQIWSP